MTDHKPAGVLKPYLSQAEVWGIALGTAIGWGSLVVTSNTYLAQAGPMGSTLGMLLGAAIMLVIARNYHYMIGYCPKPGGAFSYTVEAFGYDRGFLCAWFLALTYLAVLWANVTSIPLFVRYFLGDVVRVGYLYTFLGYRVYLGEALLSMASLLVIAFVCIHWKKGASMLMLGLGILFTLGITVCFVGAMLGHSQPLSPAFVPEKNSVEQVLRIAAISPWAFIGFESISHGAAEYKFPLTKTFRIFVVAVVSTTLLYIFILLLSVTAYPARYDSWLAYIRDLGNLDGLEALPPFYAANRYLGSFGVGALMLSLLALVVTSLIGNMLALSRLFYSLAIERVMPWRYCHTNKQGIPDHAIRLIALGSCLVPFVGRTAIGWIVDVTTLGATLIYGFVSAAVWQLAEKRKDKREKFSGVLGTVIMIAFGLYLLVPNLFSTSTIEAESYFLFVAWSVLGLAYFHVVLRKDKDKRFGHNMIVWVAFLSLVVFVSLVWSTQYNMRATTAGIQRIQQFYQESGADIDGSAFVQQVIDHVRDVETRGILAVVTTFALSLGMLISNYSTMHSRVIASEAELGAVKNQANTDPLTGVKSKLAFAEKEKEINALIQNGEAEEFSVIICDVNGLKHINDTLGHKAGDQYIFDSSRLICNIFKHSPVFRIGGDEFAVLLRGLDYESRDLLMQMFNRKVEDNLKKPGQPVVSAGLADFAPAQDATFHSVFERADSQMYARKQQLKGLGARTRD